MTTFAVRCDNPAGCPYEPDDGYRHATMPTVGDNLTAWPSIRCTCGRQVEAVYEVDE